MSHCNDYFMGWVIGRANIYDDKICFFIKQHDKDIVSKLYNILVDEYNIDLNAIYYNITKSYDFYLQIKLKSLSRDIIYKLQLKSKNTNRAHYYLKNYITFNNPSNSVLYIRGLFEANGFLYKKNDILCCGLRSFSYVYLREILYHISFLFNYNNFKVRYNNKYSNYYFLLKSLNAYHFLNYIYKDVSTNYTLNRKYNLYLTYKQN